MEKKKNRKFLNNVWLIRPSVAKGGHNEKELSRKMSGWVAKPNLNDINLTVPF